MPIEFSYRTLLAILIPPLFALVTTAARAEVAYPLTCRGGGNLTFKLESEAGKTQALINFKAGTAPARQGLAAGQCSWFDRGFRPLEPTQLCHEIGNFSVSYKAPNFRTLNLVMVKAEGAPYLSVLRDPRRFVTFNVYNDNLGCMRVVNVGPQKLKVAARKSATRSLVSSPAC